MQWRSARLIPGCLAISPDRFRRKFCLLFIWVALCVCVCVAQRSLEQSGLKEKEVGNSWARRQAIQKGEELDPTHHHYQQLLPFFNISRCRLPLSWHRGAFHLPPGATKYCHISVQVGLFYDKTKITGLEKEPPPPNRPGSIHSMVGLIPKKKKSERRSRLRAGSTLVSRNCWLFVLSLLRMGSLGSVISEHGVAQFLSLYQPPHLISFVILIFIVFGYGLIFLWIPGAT